MPFAQMKNWRENKHLSGLLDLPNPPKNLYFRGTWDDTLFSNCVAIVGSRHMTTYGRQVIEKLVPSLVLAGKTIISGFMYGCDQYAHQMTLENGGKTIAILGFGIDYPLDGKDRQLANHIVDTGGLVLSEWETQKPTLWTFPLRNRLVVALSQEVFVIEAAVKSGSLTTAALALKYQRQLWAVPGNITSKTSEGTNRLLATGEAKSWLGEFVSTPTVDDHEPLLSLIDKEPLSANEIARTLKQDIAVVGAQLSFFTLTGKIVERGGKYYVS